MEAPTRLRLLRKAKGLTQLNLSLMAGVGQSQVCSAEKGYASSAALEKIAIVLGEQEPKRLLERAVPAVPEAAAPLAEETTQRPTPSGLPLVAVLDAALVSVARDLREADNARLDQVLEEGRRLREDTP